MMLPLSSLTTLCLLDAGEQQLHSRTQLRPLQPTLQDLHLQGGQVGASCLGLIDILSY